MEMTLDKNTSHTTYIRGDDVKRLSQIVSPSTHKEIIEFLLETAIPRILNQIRSDKNE